MYGLITKNNDGEIQIDSIYRNFSLDETFTSEIITNGNHVFGSYYTGVTLSSSPLVPLVLMRPDTDRFVVLRSYNRTDSNYNRADFITEASTGGALTTDIDIKSYRENRTASGEDYGLLVYNSGGSLCFDSGKSYFKIHAVESITLSAPSEGSAPYEDITHGNIANPYYILSPMSIYAYGYFLFQPPPTFAVACSMIGIKKLTSTSVRVGWFFYRLSQTGGLITAAGVNPTMKLIICDVG